MTSETEFGSRLERSSRSASLNTETLQRFVFNKLNNFFKWIFSTSLSSILSSALCVVIVKYCVGCERKIILCSLSSKARPYVNPLFSTKNRYQLSVRLQCLKVILVVYFRSIRVQVNSWQARLTKLLHRFLLKFAKVSSHHRLLDLPRYVFDLEENCSLTWKLSYPHELLLLIVFHSCRVINFVSFSSAREAP